MKTQIPQRSFSAAVIKFSKGMSGIQPIFFEPYLKRTIWGGDKLQAEYGKLADAASSTGESWEASAICERESIVKNGEFKGLPLSDFYAQNRELFGVSHARFPFLIKLIDARSWLSVQVHPGNDEHGTGKCEAWIVLEAEPGAKLILGDKLSGKEELKNLAGNKALINRLKYYTARKGDVFFVSSGAVHAIGSGLVIYEIAQPSDITYRLYDLTGNRMLNIEEACAAYDKHALYGRILPQMLPDGDLLLLSCEYFAVGLVGAKGSHMQQAEEKFSCFTALGDGRVSIDGDFWDYCKGDTFLVPAGLGGLELLGGPLLKAWVPEC